MITILQMLAWLALGAAVFLAPVVFVQRHFRDRDDEPGSGTILDFESELVAELALADAEREYRGKRAREYGAFGSTPR